MTGNNDTAILSLCILVLIIFNFIGNIISSEFSGEHTETDYEIIKNENIIEPDGSFLVSVWSASWEMIKFIFAVLFWNFNIPFAFQIFPIQLTRIMLYFIVIRLIRGTG